MAHKFPRGLVALSASAIAAIYAAGFAVTRSADAGLAGSGSAPASASSASTRSASSAPTVVVGASAPATSARTSTAAAASSYADGTYRGQGTSRRGGVSVAVTVQGGAITNVQITGVNTEYPVSRIASLPGAVVKQQTANVNTISGATYSSQAFTQAVQQALTLAQAGTGPTTG